MDCKLKQHARHKGKDFCYPVKIKWVSCMIRLLVTLVVIFYSLSVIGKNAEKRFSVEEKKEIGKIATDYLVEHPEFLIQASKKLQAQQAQKQRDNYVQLVMGNGKTGKEVPQKLLHDSDTPYVGPDNAKVAVIEFFDYQCVFCSKVAPALEQLIKDKTNSDVKFIFKDYPIFGSQWDASDYAANISKIAFDQGGGELYHQYHNKIFGTGKDEGQLTIKDINEVAKSLKIKLGKYMHSDSSKEKDAKKEKVELLPSIEQNMKFGNSLDIMGTPFIIVMPVNGANKDNVTVFSGYPSDPQKGVSAAVKAMQDAIDKAKGVKVKDQTQEKSSK